MLESILHPRMPLILFREGKIKELHEEIKLHDNERIVIVTGQHSFISTPTASAFLERLESEGISFRIVKIPVEPTPEIIDNAVEDFNDWDAKLVVAIGGGSVMDSGKAISAMMFKGESVIDFLEGIGTKKHPGTKVPFIAVPTTSGTGSEATMNAVISRIGPYGFKRSLRHDNFIPDIAFIDPELTLTCPPDITAASGMDCFSQLTEAYLSVDADGYSDSIALEGFRSLKKSLLKCYLDGSDIKARSAMSFAALASGLCLTCAGLGAVHGFASSIGGMFDIPHGIICGTLMADTNEMMVRKLRKTGNDPVTLEKYAILGEIFLDEKDKSNDFYIDGFISYLHEMTDRLRLPGLKSSGMDGNALDHICTITDVKKNPVAFNKDELMEILSKRLT